MFGEHAVVHSQPAIASSLDDLRIYCSISYDVHEESSNDGQMTIEMPDYKGGLIFNALTKSCKIENATFSANAPSVECVESLQILIQKISKDDLREDEIEALTPLFFLINGLIGDLLEGGATINIFVRSKDLPVGAGLGSSAAFSVAASAGLLQLRSRVAGDLIELGKPSTKNLDIINAWAFAAEGVIHGNPSGLDNTVSCFGGAVYYQKEAVTGSVKAFDQLTIAKMDIILTNTFVPRSTKALVAGVGQRKENFKFAPYVITAIGNISDQFRDIITSNTQDPSVISDLIQTNQLLLQSLGVSHETLNEICRITQKMDISSKLTGAGGGGCALTYIEPDCKYTKREVMDMIEQSGHGFKCLESSVGGFGVLFVDFAEFVQEK